MKVVFDPNIYISVFVILGSKVGKAIIKIVEGDEVLIVSKDILELSRRIHVFKDVADNKILECAFAGKASAIVTGDKEMLEFREFKGIKIISLNEYLEGSGS